jgi:thioredoxin-related protein
MKSKLVALSWFFITVCLVGLHREIASAGDTPKSTRPPIYDESADGSKQIGDALALARKDGRHVLLQFGANWCSWCHKLHKLYQTDPEIAKILKQNYVVVMVDVNKEHNKEVDTKYGHPTRLGLPVIVILDADGKILTTQDSGKLEQGDHHDPRKVIAFLQQWTPAKK